MEGPRDAGGRLPGIDGPDDPNGEFEIIHPSGNAGEQEFGRRVARSLSIVGEYRLSNTASTASPRGTPGTTSTSFVSQPAPVRRGRPVGPLWGPVGEFSQRGSRFADSIRGGLLVGADWRPHDRFFIGLGVLGISEIGEEALIQPIVLITWKITDRFKFTTQSWTSRGGRARFSYAFDGGWEASLAAGRERERFRLDKRLPGVGDGVGEKNSFPVTFTVAKTLASGITLEAYGGPVLDGELRIEDQNGNNIAVSDFERSWYVGAAMKLPF